MMDMKSWLNGLITLMFLIGSDGKDSCSKDEEMCSSESFSHLKEKRYLLYDVNPGEGFNLRRDVYMRIATLAKKIRSNRLQEDWILVLPPWGPLYHWKSKTKQPQMKILWSEFFDLPSLSKYVPVIEFENFLIESGNEIEEVYYLQHYSEGWSNGKWEEKMDIRDCLENHHYVKINGIYHGWFWDYNNVYTRKFNCLSVQGYSSTLIPLFTKLSKAKSIMIDRAEVILHDNYGDKNYWDVRRSMRFASALIKIGNKFRQEYLNSSDDADNTILTDDWQKMKIEKRSSLGGPYIAVHLRRQDFIHSRSVDVPSIKYASKQIERKLKKYSLTKVFVATDAPNHEFEEFKSYLKEVATVVRYVPSKKILETHRDGGIAIIDQWICSHARYFIGTFESTFSFRIQEEREILGFPPETTFNRLCGDQQKSCEQPARWTVVYD